MKKTTEILEILLLIFILCMFTWGRFDAKLSTPLSTELTGIRILINFGITVAVILRISQLIKLLGNRGLVKIKSQFMALGLYVIMIGNDLLTFIKWNIYTDLYFHFSATLLTPVVLGIINVTLNEMKKRNPNTQ